MIYEITVTVECDGEGCSNTEEISPEYVYTDYSGKNGYYDTKDESIEKILIRERGWAVKDGKHLCYNCVDDPNEDDEELGLCEPCKVAGVTLKATTTINGTPVCGDCEYEMEHGL